jgi:hypothetical protein
LRLSKLRKRKLFPTAAKRNAAQKLRKIFPTFAFTASSIRINGGHELNLFATVPKEAVQAK